MMTVIRGFSFALAAVLAWAWPAIGAPAWQPGGAVRGLVVGIDEYRHAPPLRGAVADAQDIAQALKSIGVGDLTLLTDGKAGRAALLRELTRMVDRARAGDTVFLSFAGYGALEPSRRRGSEARDEVLLLAGFDPAGGAGAREKLIGGEIRHFVKRLEDKGARVVVVSDTCHGEDPLREVDPRGGEMHYRSLTYRPVADGLKPVASAADMALVPADFHQSVFLAAGERGAKVPEVRIPGVGWRGALSYAVARGLEGAADSNGDGRVTTAELFDYARNVAYQLTDQRQLIVTGGAALAPGSAAGELTRGIAVQAPGSRPSSGGLQITAATPEPPPAAPPPAATSVAARPAPTPVPPRPVAGAAAGGPSAPIRLAALDGQGGGIASFVTATPYEVVAPNANPDLIWDPKTRDVLAGGDVIARDIDRNDLPGVIERASAVSWLKIRATKSPQPIRITPNDKLHRKGSRVEVQVSGVAGRSLILFNIAGDGTVQLLYPLGSDPPIRKDDKYAVQLQVREPLGADLIVAVSSTQRMPDLERAINNLHRRRTPMKATEALQHFARNDAWVGSAGLFSAP